MTFFAKSITLLWTALLCAPVILRAQSEDLPWQRMLASREMVNRHLIGIARQLCNDAASFRSSRTPTLKGSLWLVGVLLEYWDFMRLSSMNPSLKSCCWSRHPLTDKGPSS